MKQPKPRWNIRGLKAVILILSLWVAAWGSPAPGHAFTIVSLYSNYLINGQVDPIQALSDAYVIVGNGSSYSVTGIGSLSAGPNSSNFWVSSIGAPTSYTVMGLYAPNQISIGLSATAYSSALGADWNTVFPILPYSNESFMAYTLSLEKSAINATFIADVLEQFFEQYQNIEQYFGRFPGMGTACSLMNFSGGTYGGTASFNDKLVPLPPSLLLLGSGLLGVAGWRGFNKG